MWNRPNCFFENIVFKTFLNQQESSSHYTLFYALYVLRRYYYQFKRYCTIKDLISCETKIKELIALLNVKPKPKFNESSMILVHHPIKQSNRYNILYYKCR